MRLAFLQRRDGTGLEVKKEAFRGKIYWDYNEAGKLEDIIKLAKGNKWVKDEEGKKLIARILVSTRWYNLIDIFGMEKVYSFLKDSVLKYVWPDSLRERFFYVRKILKRILRKPLYIPR